MMRMKIISLLCALGLLLPGAALQAGQRETGFFARAQIDAWQGERFTLTPIDTFERYDSFRVMLENWVTAYPGKVQTLQDTIRSNPALAAALRARHVQLGNVVATQQGFNGNLVFYLR